MRRILAIVLLVCVTACGFRPMYGSSSGELPSMRQELSSVFVETIPERSGLLLRNRLIEQLGFGNDPAAPRYTLGVQLSESISSLGIRKDATSSYGRLSISARYVLKDTRTGKTILTDTTRAFSGFTIVDSEYAALTAQRDARQKVLQQLAEVLARRVAVKLSTVESLPAPHETERR